MSSEKRHHDGEDNASAKRARTVGEPFAYGGKIESLVVRDIRFPTSKEQHCTDPDYSAAYVVVNVSPRLAATQGHGLSFTLGRGTEVVVCGIRPLERLIVGRSIDSIFINFAGFWREITSESQLRWVST